jgi:hypothetical protein
LAAIQPRQIAEAAMEDKKQEEPKPDAALTPAAPQPIELDTLPRSDGHNPFALPAGLRSAGDPVDGNPFPANLPEHRVWQEATLKAEEELCRFNSEFQKIQPTGNEGFAAWIKRGGPAWAADADAAWSISMCVGKFDIWAKRGIQIVWSENALREYDEWLFRYAQAWIDSHMRARHRLSESSLLELRSKLIGRMELWKSEARRYLSEQRNQAAQPPNFAPEQNDPASDALRSADRQTSGGPGLPKPPASLRMTDLLAPSEDTIRKDRTTTKKDNEQRENYKLAKAVHDLVPRCDEGLRARREAQARWPTDRVHWESAIRQVGFTAPADVDALISSKTAAGAAQRIVAHRKGLTFRGVRNAYSACKESFS